MRTVVNTAADSSLNARRTVGTRSAEAPPRTTRSVATTASATRGFKTGASEGTGGGDRKSGRGFGAWNKRVVSKSREYSTFQVPENKKKVIAFLEAENYDMVFRHWVPTTTEDGRSFNVPRNCILDEEAGVSCPLCDVGDEPKPVALFNIVDLDEPGKVTLWEAGKEVMRRIEELYAELQEIPEDRGGPLELNGDGVYVSVSRKKKKNGYWEYTLVRVKPRDLDEDFGLEPIEDAQFDELMTKLNKSEDIKFNTAEELAEMAANLPE